MRDLSYTAMSPGCSERAVRILRHVIPAIGCLVLWCAPRAAADLPPSVRAIFEARCLSCHNDADPGGGLSLQTAAAVRDSGYLIPGAPDDSYLLSVLQPIDGERPQMPKEGDALGADDVESIRAWIADGAPWDEATRLAEPVVDDFDWWSWKSLRRPEVPEFPDADARDWIQTPVDAFILRQHRERGLTAAPSASRRVLIRRLTFDLTGLPPDPDDIDAFVADPAPDAFERRVERLLASPAYGERWARHWLDVVKYADTHGYDKDKLRPNAWPYRDYVIRSFNEDKPWGRFIREQIAGDVLFPGDPQGILGLGFLAAGPWDFIGHVEVPESKQDGQVARNLDRDDMVSNVMNAFCSVTIQCARCHNHKFDPITQEQYYGLQAVFAAVDRAERRYDTDSQTHQRRIALESDMDRLQSRLAKIDRVIAERGGAELQQREAEVAELQSETTGVIKEPAFGYHSQIVAHPDTQKWVEVDLGRPCEIRQIILNPCHDEYAGIGAGFGFPRRYHVECRGSDDGGPPQRVADRTATNVPNPGLDPVTIDTPPLRAQFVRVTATRLAERSDDYHFALAELQVIDADGVNVAANASVTALDSIEAPVRWQRRNLTDGVRARWQEESVVRRRRQAEDALRELHDKLTTPEEAESRRQLQQQLTSLRTDYDALPEPRAVYAAATEFAPQGNFHPTQGTPRDVRVLRRGEVGLPGPPAVPGRIPLSEGDDWTLTLPEDATEADRRAALANWIAADDNPLTWRSLANRIWLYHFGAGLVDSPNDFGRMGRQPSHPDLLDWLADELRRTQSVKHLHRLILLSAAWQQSSQTDAADAETDAENRFLWRSHRRRLSAEEIRDAMLAVSGRLNADPGGPGFYLFELEKTAHSPHYEYHKFDPDDPASHRRSVYRFIVRSQPDPFMTTLDCADSSQSTPQRTETQTPLQSLSLLNNPFVTAMAGHFADRVEARAAEPEDRVRRAFRLVTGRLPNAGELAELLRFAEQHGMDNLCRALFNLNEFLFVD